VISLLGQKRFMSAERQAAELQRDLAVACAEAAELLRVAQQRLPAAEQGQRTLEEEVEALSLELEGWPTLQETK